MNRHSARDVAAGDTAMTEIALALAMAFFSVLVLALVSMGGGQNSDTPQTAVEILAASFAPPASSDAPAASAVSEEDKLVIYHQSNFFDRDLQPLSDAELQSLSDPSHTGGRVILAIPPDLPLGEAMEVRARISHPDAIVTPLTDDWMARLSQE